MAYRYGEDREQTMLFPESLESAINLEHPVRAYDVFVDRLDFKEIKIKWFVICYSFNIKDIIFIKTILILQHILYCIVIIRFLKLKI